MKKMRFVREQKGISQSSLSHIAGMHVTTISQIESGRLKPYPNQIAKIAHALDYEGDPYELFEEVK